MRFCTESADKPLSGADVRGDSDHLFPPADLLDKAFGHVGRPKLASVLAGQGFDGGIHQAIL
jgi:hypothetical protein